MTKSMKASPPWMHWTLSGGNMEEKRAHMAMKTRPTRQLLMWRVRPFITLRPRQDGRHFADDIFTCNFFNENCCILIKFSLKYIRKGPIDQNPALVQIMAWRRSGDKPLSEPMMISLPTHICVTRPQWVIDLCFADCFWTKSLYFLDTVFSRPRNFARY